MYFFFRHPPCYEKGYSLLTSMRQAEQEERRRLEALVRTLKKGGNSSLSYSMTA